MRHPVSPPIGLEHPPGATVHRAVVGVESRVAAPASRRGLLGTLEGLLPLRFVDAGMAALPIARPAASIRFQGDPSQEARATAQALPSLTLASSAPAGQRLERIEVRFSADREVPLPFRDRALAVEATPGCPLIPGPGERVLASGPHGALWTVAVVAGIQHFRSAMPLVETDDGAGFSQVFSGDRFLENLPLMHFLRSTVLGDVDRSPAQRAAFMFDDPNLHWPRYGFIDFLETAKRAERENYHVSFATIPLDAWFCHADTAAIFRRHPGVLSLLIHGNNHSKHELARVGSEAERQGLLSQAMRRIEGLESKSALPVCRVMVPPHGACSEAMLAALPPRGFESACISSGSLQAHNPRAAWVDRLGFDPAEMIAGCPVLPRWSLAGNVRNTILVAAYLGRPIVLRGHHQDVREGLEVLDGHAAFINGLGPVKWLPLSALSRMSYRYRMVDGLCRVTPFARRISVDLPASATRLVIDDGAGSPWRASLAGAELPLPQGQALIVPAGGPRRVELLRCDPAAALQPFVPNPRTGAVPRLRRMLTECRDRSLPWLSA